MTLSGFVHVFDQITNPIIITTPYNKKSSIKILYVNEAFEKLSGYKHHELIGKSPKIFQGEKSNISCNNDFAVNLPNAGKHEWVTTNYRKDRTPYIVKISITHIKNNGINNYSLGILTEIK